MVSRFQPHSPGGLTAAKPPPMSPETDERRKALLAYKQGQPGAGAGVKPQAASLMVKPQATPSTSNPGGVQMRGAPGQSPAPTPSPIGGLAPGGTATGVQKRGDGTIIGAGAAKFGSTPKPPGVYDELARQKEEQAKQRAVEERRLQESRAKALQDARARMNLAGGGLSGLSAAVDSRVSADQNAGITDALSAFDRNAQQANRDLARDERERKADEMQAIRDDVELKQLEEELGIPLDDDGEVGFDDPTDPSDRAEERRAYAEDLRARNQTKDLFGGDNDTPDGQGGTPEEPLRISRDELQRLHGLGATFKQESRSGWSDGQWKTVVLWVDDLGNYYQVGG
jgi:hypothetical protein